MTDIFTFQSLGKRDNQQDRMAAFELNKEMSENDLLNLFSKMATRTLSINDYGGSTATMCIINKPNHIITGQLGDSAARLIVQRKDNILTTQPLTPEHDIDTESERFAPFIENGGIETDERLGRWSVPGKNASWNLTRSFGDSAAGKAMSKAPEIQSYDLTCSTDSARPDTSLCLYTDGAVNIMAPSKSGDFVPVTLGKDLEFDTFLNMIQANSINEKLENFTAIASNLTLDNLTFISTHLNKENLQTPIILGVFDGHGKQGEDVAQACVNVIAEQPFIEKSLI